MLKPPKAYAKAVGSIASNPPVNKVYSCLDNTISMVSMLNECNSTLGGIESVLSSTLSGSTPAQEPFGTIGENLDISVELLQCLLNRLFAVRAVLNSQDIQAAKK